MHTYSKKKLSTFIKSAWNQFSTEESRRKKWGIWQIWKQEIFKIFNSYSLQSSSYNGVGDGDCSIVWLESVKGLIWWKSSGWRAAPVTLRSWSARADFQDKTAQWGDSPGHGQNLKSRGMIETKIRDIAAKRGSRTDWICLRNKQPYIYIFVIIQKQ